MITSLDQIVAAARLRVAEAKRDADVRTLEKSAQAHTPRGFRRHLEMASESGVAIIAELKKASPSKGVIREEFDVSLLARELESGGAAALSVLTDHEFFQGSLQNLQIASTSTRLPCLRKDFIVDEFQLLEARANRADAVLLIVAALSADELKHLAGAALKFELDVLCEVHDEKELQAALDAGFELVGVNNRDLRTFKVDLATAFSLAGRFPKHIFRVAESGINSGSDIARLRSAGYGAFLVGETLMRSPRPGDALRALVVESCVAAAKP